MVVLFKGYNNHSNRLFQAIHIESFCMEHGLTFYNPSFWKMKALYGVKGKWYDAIVWSVLCSLNKVRLLPKVKFISDEKRAVYDQQLLRKKLVFVHGWRFRNNDLTEKYQRELVAKYAVLPELYETNELYQRISALDRTACNLIGVHIRKGDYRTWKNGIYFFEDEVYQKYMQAMEAALNTETNKKNVFLLFSNEPTSIPESESVIVSRNPWYVDQKIMSLCDYLIGPPSTFTLWASYLGDAKYFHLLNDSGKINLHEFSSCKG